MTCCYNACIYQLYHNVNIRSLLSTKPLSATVTTRILPFRLHPPSRCCLLVRCFALVLLLVLLLFFSYSMMIHCNCCSVFWTSTFNSCTQGHLFHVIVSTSAPLLHYTMGCGTSTHDTNNVQHFNPPQEIVINKWEGLPGYPTSVETLPPSGKRVSSVHVTYGGLVDSSTFIFNDGTSFYCGNSKGGPVKEDFELKPDEYIRSILFRTTNQLCGIQFETNYERMSKGYLMAGVKADDRVHWQWSNSGRISRRRRDIRL